jgi:hypothetical protein
MELQSKSRNIFLFAAILKYFLAVCATRGVFGDALKEGSPSCRQGNALEHQDLVL